MRGASPPPSVAAKQLAEERRALIHLAAFTFSTAVSVEQHVSRGRSERRPQTIPGARPNLDACRRGAGSYRVDPHLPE